MNNTKPLVLSAIFAAVSAGAYAAPVAAQDPAMSTMSMAKAHSSSTFKGAEANGGFATLSGRTLKLSPDFKIPKAPAPTWQVVDKDGNVYTLRQINVVGGKTNRSVEIPSYVKSVAKVRIYCTFAEINLGEATFAEAIDLS